MMNENDKMPLFLEENEQLVENELLENKETEIECEVKKEAENAISNSLVRLGFVNFDGNSVDNTTSNAMVSAEHRGKFRRDVYVGVRDTEQGIDFLGRVVEGPFHQPHEVGLDSAITRTTVLHPDRTQFRPTYYVAGTIEILGQLTEDERLVPTPTRPRPYSEIYIFPQERLKRFLDINGEFNLGQLMGYEGLAVTTDINNKNFLPRNIGVFGTVGSGKSNTTQVIIEEAVDAGWAVVVIDVEGEYVRMNETTTDQNLKNILLKKYQIIPTGIGKFQVYVPQSGHSEAQNPISFKVPISQIDPFVLADLMELSEPQARLLEAMIEKLSRTGVQKSTSTRLGSLASSSCGNQGNAKCFTLQTLIDGLTSNPPLIPGQREDVMGALRSKLYRLGTSQMLDWNATSGTNDLPVDDLLVEGKLSVLDVSETDDRSRNIAIAHTLQSLFDRVIQTEVGSFMPNGRVRPKVLVVIEEVHTFVSKSNATKMRSVLDSLQVISRRGRKRWMALTLVSQQPGHVPEELFELANTRFIHQLKSVANLTPVKQTTGGVHEALWSNLPSLGPGQSLVTGAVFKNPLFVEIRPAKSRRMMTS